MTQSYLETKCNLIQHFNNTNLKIIFSIPLFHRRHKTQRLCSFLFFIFVEQIAIDFATVGRFDIENNWAQVDLLTALTSITYLD